QALFAAVLLSVSTVPGDTYQKSLAGALITLDITCGCILLLACFGAGAPKHTETGMSELGSSG
ncbi:MAG: hypothetical protein ACM3ZE_21520, partial [Myxococcales bacterium]